MGVPGGAMAGADCKPVASTGVLWWATAGAGCEPGAGTGSGAWVSSGGAEATGGGSSPDPVCAGAAETGFSPLLGALSPDVAPGDAGAGAVLRPVRAGRV